MDGQLACRWSLVLLAGPLFAADAAQGYIADDRWNVTATNPTTGDPGEPATVTWSFAADGTLIPGSPSGAASSNLIAFLDATWGMGAGGGDLTQRPWFFLFDEPFARLSELSGVTFLYEPHDDGAAFSSASSARGVIGVRGDTRLAGKSFGQGVVPLAATFLPDFAEMMINTDPNGFLTDSSNNYRAFRNMLMHEAMHSLGVNHIGSANWRFLMEPLITTAFDGPQLDDVLALHRLYGDVLEKNGGNNTLGTATALGGVNPSLPLIKGSLGDATVITASAVDFLSIDDDSDADYFSFTLGQALDVVLTATPKGATYRFGASEEAESVFHGRSASNLSLTLFDGGGAQLGLTADLQAAGLGESIQRQLDAGTYFARVLGEHDEVQLYQLTIIASPIDLTADFNTDGRVDGLDLATWQAGFGGLGAGRVQGDADADQDIDGADFLVWQRQLSGGAWATPRGHFVPEPTGGSLLCAALCIIAMRRRASPY